MILSAWIRYAGTAPTITGNNAYALLIIGQVRNSTYIRPLLIGLACFRPSQGLRSQFFRLLDQSSPKIGLT